MASTTHLETVAGTRTLAEIEEAGRLEAVAIDELHFDKLYQRDISSEWVQTHGEDYSPRKAGTIILNRRKNGELWVIDGQHRTASAQLAGHTHMLALVFDQLSPREEAGMRVAYNDRRVDDPLARFKAQLYAGDPQAKAIAEICERFGTRINNTPETERGINCIGAIEKLYKRDDGMTLARVFEIVQRGFGSVSGQMVKASQLHALAWLLEANAAEKIDINRLVEVLQVEGWRGIRGRAESHRMAAGGVVWVNTYRALIEVYNVSLPQGRRLSVNLSGRGNAGTRRTW